MFNQKKIKINFYSAKTKKANDTLKNLKKKYKNYPINKADIIVSTIHGVKGMERKKVILSSDWGYGSLLSYNSGIIRLEDEEIRVCYVGVSRAEEELYIFNSTYKNTFPLLSQEALRGVI